MRKISDEELKVILKNHIHYLRKDCDNWQDLYAKLSGVDLSGKDLSYAVLCSIDLDNSILDHTNLTSANLCRSRLNNTRITNANLRHANLSYTNIAYVDLYSSDICYATFEHAYAVGANFVNTKAISTNFEFTDLRFANLFNMQRGMHTMFNGANLKDVSYPPRISLACPDTGSFIGWKKASNKIIKLLIPEDAIRLSNTQLQCRCNKAIVIGIEEFSGINADVNEVPSDFDVNFIYKIGREVVVKDFCKDWQTRYAPGIHFFINRQDAVEW